MTVAQTSQGARDLVFRCFVSSFKFMLNICDRVLHDMSSNYNVTI